MVNSLKPSEFLTSLNILYIEDEDNIRKNMSSTLKLISNNVFDVSNCADALKLYHIEHIDIILSDISMPKMNGLEFTKIIRENNKKIPIILLTAHTDTPYLLEAAKLKLVDYLIKPLSFTQLKEVLEKAAKEVYENCNFLIHFNNNISYSILEKRLFNSSIDLAITSKEISLLELLYNNRNRVVHTEEIRAHVWENSYEATDPALKAVLNKLRKKIGKNSIRNISGIGYQINLA